jgi:hypothetical protein
MKTIGIVLVASIAASAGRVGLATISSTAHQLGSKPRQRLGAAFGEAPFDHEVLPLHPAQVAQALLERAEHRSGVRVD